MVMYSIGTLVQLRSDWHEQAARKGPTRTRQWMWMWMWMWMWVRAGGT